MLLYTTLNAYIDAYRETHHGQCHRNPINLIRVDRTYDNSHITKPELDYAYSYIFYYSVFFPLIHLRQTLCESRFNLVEGRWPVFILCTI